MKLFYSTCSAPLPVKHDQQQMGEQKGGSSIGGLSANSYHPCQAGLRAIRRKKYKVFYLYAFVCIKVKAPRSNLKSDRAQRFWAVIGSFKTAGEGEVHRWGWKEEGKEQKMWIQRWSWAVRYISTSPLQLLPADVGKQLQRIQLILAPALEWHFS